MVGSADTWPFEWSRSASLERLELRVVEHEQPLGAELLRERRGARAVTGVVRLVLAPGVVEEPEAEDDDGVRPVEGRAELETGRGHAAPVRLAVPGRVPPPRPRQHGRDERRQRPRFHPVTIAHWAEVSGEGEPWPRSRRRRAICSSASPPSRP